MTYAWNFAVVLQYKDALFNGLMITVSISVLVIFFATILGIILGTIRGYIQNRYLNKFASAAIELLRAIPKIVLLVWVFYAFPILTGIHFPPFQTAVIALSLVSSAFIAEIVRSGIDSIPKGHIEAAKVLGMSDFQILSTVVLPQALMKNVPPIIGEYSTTIKDSTLAVIIGVNELLHATSDAAILSYRPMELYTALGIIFLILIISVSLLSKKLEFKRLTQKQ